MADRDWHNLARQVKKRREELDLTQQEVAAAGGPSTAVQRQIENEQATSYRPNTFRSHEKALCLRKGSFRAALTGGTFAPLDDDWPPSPPRDLTMSLDGLSDEEKKAMTTMRDAFLRARQRNGQS